MAEISNSKSNTVITGTPYNNSIENFGSNVTINALGGKGYKDTIENHGWSVKINCGDSNDLIDNYGSNVTIDGGGGKDTINNGYDNSYSPSQAGGDTVIIDGGDGNDLIENSGSDVSINGGAGDDKIYGSTAARHLYQYESGNDTIYSWSSNDTLTIPATVSLTKSAATTA